MPFPFRILLAGEIVNYPDREIGLATFDSTPFVEIRRYRPPQRVLEAREIADANAILLTTSYIARESLATSQDLLAIARFGVGFDSVDVAACTDHDVLLTITPGAVDRPVAEATVTWMLALSHRVMLKDQLVRTGDWTDRSRHLGTELRDRTLGIVGFGRIGKALVRLLAGFGMRQPLVFDPYVASEEAGKHGVRLASLDELLAQSDFVSIHCPLDSQTRNLIGARELSLMKSDAFLLNLGRGGIVEEDALYQALKEHRIAGAGIDCFVGEPLQEPSRFAEFDTVLLAPHAIALTVESVRDIGTMACRAIRDLLQGTVPAGVVNPEVLEKPSFQEKWRRVAQVSGRPGRPPQAEGLPHTLYRPVPGWGTLPEGWSLYEVVSVATDSQGLVYVFNRGDHPLIVFDRDGRFLRSHGEGKFKRPHGLTIGPDDALYLTDDFDHTVHKFTRDFQHLWTLGTSGVPSQTGHHGFDYRTITHGGPPFNYPTNVALDDRGNLYISDGYGNARVHKFTPEGKLLLSFGEPGDGPGQFNIPHGIAVDARGRVVVADRENNRLQFFSQEGDFLDQWPGILRPCDVFVDTAGFYYIAEVGWRAGMWPWMTPRDPGARVSIHDPEGNLVARWGFGTNPMDPADFFAPHDIWRDADGSLYIGEVAKAAGCAKAGFPDAPVLRKYEKV